MACQYFAPTGKPSKLYDDLNTKYGESVAKNTWTYLQNPAVKEEYNLPVNERREFELSDLEANNLIIDFDLLRTEQESKENFELRGKELAAAFKEIGTEIRENTELESTAVIVNVDGKAVIEYNPEKIRKDSVYHEFGHMLVDLVGYKNPLVQAAIAEVRGTILYNTVRILNPNLTTEQLDKEVLTTQIGIEASKKSEGKIGFYINRMLRWLQEALGISESAVSQLANQLVNRNVTSVLKGKLSMYEQHQQDLRVINNVFLTKKIVLENAIIKIEQKLRDYFSALPAEERYGNPIYRDFVNLKGLLQEQKEADTTKGMVEYLTFALTQTAYLEKKIDSIMNPDRMSDRPAVTATLLRDLLNYNEAFGDIIEDMQEVIKNDYQLQRELKDYNSKFDTDVVAQIPLILERYQKVKRAGKILSLEYVANMMLNTKDNNKFVEHLKNNMKRQWIEISKKNRDLMLKDELAARKLQNEWADSEIERLRSWKTGKSTDYFIGNVNAKLKEEWLADPLNAALMAADKDAGELAQRRWVDVEAEKLVNANNNILTDTVKKYYLNLLQQTSNDIGWFERWLLAGNMINDEILQYGNEMLDKADYKTRMAMTKEFRGSFDLFGRFNTANPSSNQQEKYKAVIEKEVEMNEDGSLSFTGKNTQNLVSKYYASFFKYKDAKYKEYAEGKNTFGENSVEAEAAYDEYQKLLNENTIREFNGQYYRNLDSLPADVKKVIKPLQRKKKAILTRYAVNAKNTIYDLTNITENDAESLSNVERQLKELASKYDKQGGLKTGQSLKIATALKAYNELLGTMYTEGEFQKEMYDKARSSAYKKKRGKEFDEKNSYVGVKKEFWDDLMALVTNDPAATAIRQEIKNILQNYQSADGTVLIDELDENGVAVMKKLYENLDDMRSKNKELADWFEENVDVNVTNEYILKKEEMQTKLDNGEITQDQYTAWYNNNHKTSRLIKEQAAKTAEKEAELKAGKITQALFERWKKGYARAILDEQFDQRPLGFWTKLTPKKQKYYERKYNKHWYNSAVKDEFKNTKLQPGEEIGGMTSKWINPQFTEMQGVDKEMYDYLTKRLEEDDAPLYNDYKSVTKDDAGNKYYKIPAVIKHSDTEILGDDGVAGLFKNKYHRAKAALQGKKEDSKDFGGDVLTALYEESNNALLVQADEHGRQQHRVPVNLRTPIALEDQSFDLLSVALLNHHMSLNFQNKQKIAHELELMGDVLAERDIVETQNTFLKGTKNLINNISDSIGLGQLPITSKGTESNSYKAFKSMLEARLYGIRNKGSVRAHQITSLLTKYTGTTALALNIFSAGANLVSGRLQNYIAAAGGQFFEFKDILFARVELNKQALTIIGDTGRALPISKVGRLKEALNPQSDWVPLTKKFSMDTTLKRMFEKVDLDTLQTTGELLIQNTLMLSILNSAKAMSKNGKYLTADLQETDNEKDGVTMYEAYNNNPSELIVCPPEVAGFKIKDKVIIDSNYGFYLSFFIRELNKSLQGDYDVNSISEARRGVIGKLALVLRRWYPSTAMRRVRGMSSVLKNSAEIGTEEAYYNRATREEEEGYYTSFVRVLYQIVKEGKRLKFEEGRTTGKAILESIGTNKARLLSYEKSNVRQMFAGLAFNGLYLMLSTVLYTLGKKIPKEQAAAKNATYMLAFWILKAQRELTAYTNPNEILNTVGSPTVVLNQVKQLIELAFAMGSEVGHQFDEPFTLRRYERGKRKGNSKLFKELGDVAPILRQLQKSVTEQLSYMTNVKGF